MSDSPKLKIVMKAGQTQQRRLLALLASEFVRRCREQLKSSRGANAK